jgi:hypothetical protein
VMPEAVPPHPFDETDALAWLRSQPDGRVTANAAELGRRWGWNRMRTGRRLKAWEKAGLIRRNAEAITLIKAVTPTVTDVTPAVAGTVSVTAMSQTAVTRRSITPVKLAAFIVALALACVSAAFSIDGLTAIFAGAFWPIITMGAVLEAGKLVAAAWLTEYWNSAPPLLRLVLVAMIGVLMSLNAIGVFGSLTRAHLDHMATVDLALADRTADIDARLSIQGQTVADLDRRLAQIDAAIEESTRLGRPVGAMTIADQKPAAISRRADGYAVHRPRATGPPAYPGACGRPRSDGGGALARRWYTHVAWPAERRGLNTSFGAFCTGRAAAPHGR